MKNKNEFRTRQSAINSYMVKYKVHIVILLSLCNNASLPYFGVKLSRICLKVTYS